MFKRCKGGYEYAGKKARNFVRSNSLLGKQP